MKRLITVMAFSIASISAAHAQIPTTDIASLVQRIVMIASEYAQEAELVEQVEQTYNVVQQATNTANSLQNQLGSVLNINQALSINALLDKVRQANALNNGDARQVFIDGYAQDATFEKSHEVTSATNRQATASNAAVIDALPADAERLNRLVDQSQQATGALQAQQAGNQINAELAGQIMALRQQMALQGQAANADAEMRARTQAAQAEITRQFYGGKMQ